MPLTRTVTAGVRTLPAAAWNALVDPNDPFLEHAFLAALEDSGSVGREARCDPRFVVVHQGRELVGAVPIYVKDHSYGEFIFDWAWANAAARAGLAYYPKLVAAIPYTPVTGPRLLVRADADRDQVVRLLLEGVDALAADEQASSVHVLFCTAADKQQLGDHGYLPRLSMQFHWSNRAEPPYRDFDDYLSAFRSSNRKQVRKERAIAGSHGLRLVTMTGPEMQDREWAALQRFYRANADKHDAITYLRPAFFDLVRATHADRVVGTFAFRGDEPIAGSLNFERGRHLYGRYWGCVEELPMLHFELCYYQLIDRAIARGGTRFEAGAQGEHKLKRGLVPAFTHSAHRILHPGLAAAVGRFIEAEAEHVAAQAAEYAAHSPFARTPEPTTGSPTE